MSKPLTIGIIREGKNPPDKRVPFTPQQCREIQKKFPITFVVEPSPIRCFTDEQYREAGITVSSELGSCDVLMGVKEVPIEQLIPNKTYMFFSHTIKEQPHNRKLMQALLEKNIVMVDYETLTYSEGGRIIGFGRYAGIVGAYNAMRLYAELYQEDKLKAPQDCYDRHELEEELHKMHLPANYKIVVTGAGRVGGGCLEILHSMGLRQVRPNDFLTKTYNEPVYTQLHVEDYNKNGHPIDREKYRKDPSGFSSDFMKYAKVASMYIPCHFWDNRAPQILTAEELKDPELKLNLIADISCDVGEPIASTIRASTIAQPFYGYDKETGKEVDVHTPGCVAVMAVDNLPCSLPRNASEDFGRVLMEKILPALVGSDDEKIIERATICKDGKLMPRFANLENYAYAKA